MLFFFAKLNLIKYAPNKGKKKLRISYSFVHPILFQQQD